MLTVPGIRPKERALNLEKVYHPGKKAHLRPQGRSAKASGPMAQAANQTKAISGNLR